MIVTRPGVSVEDVMPIFLEARGNTLTTKVITAYCEIVRSIFFGAREHANII